MSMSDNYGRPSLLFYVPDEICLVATGPGDETAAQRHQSVQATLHRHLTAAINGATEPQDILQRFPTIARLHADLAPTPETFAFLRGKLAASSPILSPLPELAPAEARPRPHWIALPAPHNDANGSTERKTLHYFQVGNADDRTHPVETRARRVRDLVVLSNLLFRQANVPIRAVPNWLVGATETCPGPGSAPAWIMPPQLPSGAGYWSFAFPRAVAEIVRCGRQTPSAVKIAVLDTSPAAVTVRDAARTYDDNLLLWHVATSPNVTIDFQLPTPLHAGAHVDDVRVNWRDKGRQNGALLPNDTIRMDDHGLFVAGIIHDIAPNAEVNLIRVLNGFGVSDHHAMITALAQLPQLLDNDHQRLIVNLSLGFAIPPGIEVLRFWMQKSYEGLAAEIGNDPTIEHALAVLANDNAETRAEMEAILHELEAGLKDIIDWLTSHPQVLMVAAAGNDNGFFGDEPVRPEPRWPARYDKVLGVASVGRIGPAAYSNRGDVAVLDNGIAAFGGNAVRGAKGDLGVIAMDKAPIDAVAGIYSADRLTLGDGTNETGWVYWSGTSFATPVITALAADLWDLRLAERRRNPNLAAYGPQELIAEIVNTLFTVPRDTSDPGTLNTPAITAHQEWTTEWKGLI